MRTRILLVAVVLAQWMLGQAGAPVLEGAFATEVFVTGRAESTAGPLTVFDISYPARAKIGSGAVGRNGTFGITVKPPLKLGNRLIVVDRLNRTSAELTVQPKRKGPLDPR